MKSSAKFTQIIVRLGYVGLTAALFLFPYLLNQNLVSQSGGYENIWLLASFYCVAPAGYIALVSIDKIMQSIKNDDVFCSKIAKLLKVIVWCCFYAGSVGLASVIVIFAVHKFFALYILILVFGEYFMALICNVLKSCFEAGNLIKEENDLTI